MDLSIWIGIAIAVGGLIISFLAYQLNKANYQLAKTEEVKTDSRQDAKIQAQLDYIGKGVDDIRIDLKANEKQMVALGERVTRVEESSKQAHKRIDSLEEGGRLG